MFKIVIGDKEKAWKLETEAESILGKQLGETIKGEDVSPLLAGYELLITGGSDSAGFPLSKDAEGIGLKRVLLIKGFGMKDNYPGIRRRKTVRGKQLTANTAQINFKVIKQGSKQLAEIFPEQNQPKPKAEKKVEAAPAA